jgi:hypothetical protein
LNAGSVTVDDAGEVTGSGIAMLLYEAIEDVEEATGNLPDPNLPDDDWDGSAAEWYTTMSAQLVKVRRAWARTAIAHAETFGVRTFRSMTATGSLTGNDDTILCPARVSSTVLTMPVGMPVGTYFDIIEVGNDVVHSLTLAAPMGETIVGVTTVAVLTHRTVVKISTTEWVAHL